MNDMHTFSEKGKVRELLTFIAKSRGFSSSFINALAVTFRLMSSYASHSHDTLYNNDRFRMAGRSADKIIPVVS